MEYKPQNQMAQATSPYLRQHKDNPVHWQGWGQAAFDAARAQHKPVLLSIGYAACHWCHVMAHESFDNPAIAKLINSRFIAIKLDREERPDLDSLYQHALALMGKQGGWPLTMFLTPDGVPFWGGTYFPPIERHGMPGFADVLAGVAQSFDLEPDNVAFNAASITKALQDKVAHAQSTPVTPEIVTRAAAHFLLEADTTHGGLGRAPKFPQLTKLRLLFDHGLRSGDKRYSDAVLHALVQMCRGGLYDHLGGGFHRYCVDAQWLVPHFEKMLDDQTQFITLLCDVLSHHPHPLLQQALEDTIASVLRDMRDEKTGLLISSLDADSDGGEGTFYQWTFDEIMQELGEYADLFITTYDIKRDGNWHDPHQSDYKGNIINRLSGGGLLSREDENTLRAMRKKLFYKRQQRPAPARDDKIITDLNARMITALATAGWRLARNDWQAAAIDAFEKLAALCISDTGLVRHIATEQTSACLLDDSAQLALAALTLGTTADNPAYYHSWAKKLARQMSASFMRDDGMAMALPVAQQDSFINLPPLYDTPAPAACGALLRALVWVAQIESDQTLSDAAARLALALGAPARAEFTMMASSLAAVQFYQNPVIIHANTTWHDDVRLYVPDSIILPAQDNALTVCVGTRCLLPVHEKAECSELITTALRACLHKPANG